MVRRVIPATEAVMNCQFPEMFGDGEDEFGFAVGAEAGVEVLPPPHALRMTRSESRYKVVVKYFIFVSLLNRLLAGVALRFPLKEDR